MLILFINFLVLILFSILWYILLLKPVLKIKKLRLQPITVPIHEIKKPTILPNTTVLIAIKSANGNAGIIDSKITKNIPQDILISMLLL